MSSNFTDDFYSYFFYRNQTLLSEGRFIDFPKYGQIIFLIGGAGSGKNFALENIVGHNGINCDVDDLKTYIAREKKFQEQQYADKGNEFLQDMDFKDPNKVFQMHNFSKKIFEPEGSEMESSRLDGILKAARTNKTKTNLPNVVLNITGKCPNDFQRLAIPFVEVGYKPSDIHVIWVLTPYEDAMKNNAKRSRRVPTDILRGTHVGVKKAMDTIMNSSGLDVDYTHKGTNKRFNFSRYINGLVMILFNKPGVDSWIPNKKDEQGNDILNAEGNPVKDFVTVTKNANEEGNNAPRGIRYTDHGKLDWEDTSKKAQSSRPRYVDHVLKVVLKEIGRPFKSREELDAELKNTFNRVQQQQNNPNQKRSFKSQRKLDRRKKTEGQYNPINGIEDFDKKVSDYTNFDKENA